MNHTGKILYHRPDGSFEEKLVFRNTGQSDESPYDVAIIGAGIVGCALAYKLSQYRLKILLLDKNSDVGEGTSKGSSAIVHTGFDAPPGTLESRLVTEASRQWPELAEKLKIPFESCGALLLATDEEQYDQLEKIREKAIRNGVPDIRSVDRDTAADLEPEANKEALGGILIARESIADPFTASVAFAEVALENGTDILLGTEVTAFEDTDEPVKVLVTRSGIRIRTKIVVNVAGLGSEKLAKLYQGEPFDTNPRRGQFLLFDKVSRQNIRHILLPIPTAQTKGVLVIPTIFGNLMAGPTAEDFQHDDDCVTDTVTSKLEQLLEGASKLYPGLKSQPAIGLYSGVRANCSQGSYWIRCNDNHPGILTVAGIRSTGFTSSPALDEYLIDKLNKDMGLNLEVNPSATDCREANRWPGWWKRPYEEKTAVREDPALGEIVCFCEQISRGEIIRQLDSPLKPRTLDAIKRRTRAQTGRCQGFECMVKVASIISEHCDIPLNKITKCGPGSELFSLADVNE